MGIGCDVSNFGLIEMNRANDLLNRGFRLCLSTFSPALQPSALRRVAGKVAALIAACGGYDDVPKLSRSNVLHEPLKLSAAHCIDFLDLPMLVVERPLLWRDSLPLLLSSSVPVAPSAPVGRSASSLRRSASSLRRLTSSGEFHFSSRRRLSSSSRTFFSAALCAASALSICEYIMMPRITERNPAMSNQDGSALPLIPTRFQRAPNEYDRDEKARDKKKTGEATNLTRTASLTGESIPGHSAILLMRVQVTFKYRENCWTR